MEQWQQATVGNVDHTLAPHSVTGVVFKTVRPNASEVEDNVIAYFTR